MTYNGFYKEDVAWIERATREGVTALAGRVPLYSGLYVPDLPPADLARAAERAMAGGARGVSVFEATLLTPEHWKALGDVISRHKQASEKVEVRNLPAALGLALFALGHGPVALRLTGAPAVQARVDYEALPFSPERVVVYRANAPLTIDGRLDEAGVAGDRRGRSRSWTSRATASRRRDSRRA